jgi:threonine/homoserine/homoserine lactone efflux protein
VFGAYLTFTAILVVTPGSTTAVVVRNTLIGGRAAGLAAALGAAVANSAHATAAGLGLALLFARWPSALMLLRVAGGLYLAWLGLNSLYRVAMHADGGLQLNAGGDPVSASARRSSFRQGLAVNILNPAIATFYLVVVPTFIPADPPRWYFLALAVTHVTLALVCHSLWAIALHTIRRLLHAASARRALEGATGLALLALALRVMMR